MFTVDQHLVLTYPIRNRVTRNPRRREYRERPIRITKIRDLLAQPMTPKEFLDRPLVQRGRILLRAYDYSINLHRYFYPAASKDYYSESALRVALYREQCLGQWRFHELVSDPFLPNWLHIQELSRLLHKYGRMNLGKYALRILCDDLRICG